MFLGAIPTRAPTVRVFLLKYFLIFASVIKPAPFFSGLSD